MMEQSMTQVGPYPQALRALVDRLEYRKGDGWRVWLEGMMDRGQGSKGLTLVVQRCGPDTYNPDTILRVNHLFIVPAAAYDWRSWQRWLFDRLGDVDTHERMENFVLAVTARTCGHVPMCEGTCPSTVTRPYAPSHGEGNDPYLIREVGTLEDVETTFDGRHSPQPGN